MEIMPEKGTGGFMRLIKEKKGAAFHIVLSLLFGVVWGIFACVVNQVPALRESFVGSISATYGYWVILAMILIMLSPRAIQAGVDCLLFFVTMNTAYYLLEMSYTGVFQTTCYIRWILFSLFTFIGGFAVWFYKKPGWGCALLGSLPAAMLMGEVVTAVNGLFRNLEINYVSSVLNSLIYLLFVVFYYLQTPKAKNNRWKLLLFIATFTSLWIGYTVYTYGI